jgi:hypothetical membrane protein
MNYDNKKIAGLLFFVGAVQYVLGIVISEAVYSGYSVGQQVVSDLGDWNLAGNHAAIWNTSVILLGLFVIAGAYYIQRGFRKRLFTSLLVLNGVGWIGIGVFALNISSSLHNIFGLVGTFVFGWASVIVSYKFQKSPLSYLSVIFGAVMLVASILLESGFYLGLGLGGMQRFAIYSFLLWMLGFGAYSIGESSNTTLTSKT